jgi:DNA-directed RNA polymerase omega subunit
MADRPTLVDPPIEDLLRIEGNSKFQLVRATSMRAREISEYFNGLGSGHGAIVPPQVTVVTNKSLSFAMEEIYEGKCVVKRLTAEELAARKEAEELAAQAAAESRSLEDLDLDGLLARADD